MKPLLRRLAFFLVACSSVACTNILGTSDYEPCSGESCEDGSGGSSGTSSSTSDTDSTSSTATDCFEVTVHVSGSVKVKLETPHVDFEPGSPGPHCVPAGSTTLFAECDADGGDDPPVAVSWGNVACDDDATSCTFDLQKDETFTVAAASCP